MTQTIRIGSQILPHDPFWVQVREAAEQRARELQITLVPLATDLLPLSGEIQVQLIEEFLARELDALIISNISDHLALHVLQSGLPLVANIERELTHPLLISPSGLYDAAQLAGQFLAEQLSAKGRVLLVGGMVESVDSASTRIRGFTDLMQSFPEISIHHVQTRWRYEQACAEMQIAVADDSTLAEMDPFDGVFGLSDSIALAVRDVGQELGLTNERTQIVGLNGDPLALSAILDGSLAATVETSAVDLGRKMVEYAYAAALGKPMPSHFNYRTSLVTSENVAEVAIQKLIAIASLPTRLVDVNRRQEQQRLRQMETTLEINRRIGLFLDWPELSHGLAELIRVNYEYDDVQIFLWHEETQSLILNHSDSDFDISMLPADALTIDAEHGEGIMNGISLAVAESGVLGQALLRNQPIYLPDTRNSQRFMPDLSWPNTRSRVVLPIRLGQTMMGVLDLHSKHVTQHAQIQLDALQTLADQVGVAIRNMQLYAAARMAGVKGDKRKGMMAGSGRDLACLNQQNVDSILENDQLVQQIVAYIHANYAVAITRQQIADSVGVSADYVTRVFRKRIGCSPWKYLLQYRISRATELLEASSLAVTEVGASVGFNDPTYFSRSFRKEIGLSPLKYRKKHRARALNE